MASIKMRKLLIIYFVLISSLAFATNYTVKAGGGGSFTTIAACMSQMSSNGTGVSDTCTVFVGTYSESPTVPAGSTGNYKIVNVNGSDVVNVTGSFTLSSHTKVSGFVFNQTGTCFSLGSTATDVVVGPNNSMTSCGTFGINIGNSFIYFQGNTWAYAGCVPPNPVNTCGRAINADGSNLLIENNDFSHYQLCIALGSNTGDVSNIIVRNNTFHDQLETEAGSNTHTDAVFSQPSNGVSNILVEGNNQYNAVGGFAKSFLFQNDTGTCTTVCSQIIIRHNIINRVGSGVVTNDKTWPHVMVYNNTEVDANQDATTTFAGTDNSITAANAAYKNQIYYYTQSSINDFNPYYCNNTDCSFGSNLYWCTGTCTNIHDHTYGSSTFTTDSGNLHVNPLFVNYVGIGNPANDFHLQSSSPAIATGTKLTTVAAGDSGSGTSLVVTDATYFQDGYGLVNALSTVQGDCVSVGTVTNHVCVTAVNYSTNTLTLAGSISRSSGQSVWLYRKSDGVQVLTGSAPDMGALPFQASSAAPAPASCPACMAQLPEDHESMVRSGTR